MMRNTGQFWDNELLKLCIFCIVFGKSPEIFLNLEILTNVPRDPVSHFVSVSFLHQLISLAPKALHPVQYNTNILNKP